MLWEHLCSCEIDRACVCQGNAVFPDPLSRCLLPSSLTFSQHTREQIHGISDLTRWRLRLTTHICCFYTHQTSAHDERPCAQELLPSPTKCPQDESWVKCILVHWIISNVPCIKNGKWCSLILWLLKGHFMQKWKLSLIHSHMEACFCHGIKKLKRYLWVFINRSPFPPLNKIKGNCNFLSHNSDLFLRIARFKLTIACYKVTIARYELAILTYFLRIESLHQNWE